MPLGLGNFISSSWVVVRGAEAYSLCLCKPHRRDIFHNQKMGASGWLPQDLQLPVVIMFPVKVSLLSVKQK